MKEIVVAGPEIHFTPNNVNFLTTDFSSIAFHITDKKRHYHDTNGIVRHKLSM